MPIKQLPSSRSASDVDILEPLGLPLRGFQTNDETPTTAPTSLPTPSCERLQHVQVLPDPTWLLPSGIDLDIETPGAPLLRDYDSFTEGTAKGSFDSIPIASADQFGELLVVLDHEAVGALPNDIGARSTIEQWRDGVYQSIDSPSLPFQYLEPPPIECGYEDEDGEFLVTPTKRPRSITSDEGERRTRPRRHSMIVSTLACFNQSNILPPDVMSSIPHRPDHHHNHQSDLPSRLRSHSAPPDNREAVPPP